MSWADLLPAICFVVGYLTGTAATLWVTLVQMNRTERARRARRGAEFDAMCDQAFAKLRAAYPPDPAKLDDDQAKLEALMRQLELRLADEEHP